LVDILQGFYDFEGGEILINDIDIHQLNVSELRDIIAVVPQKEKIFNSSVIDNICLSNNQNELEDVIKFCEKEGFNNFIEKFQQGYLTLAGENGVNLSGGQRQLISLARAMYKKPDFLILDEATAAMDTETERFVFNMLREKQDIGILIITHRLDLVKKADKIYQLKNNMVSLVNEHQIINSSDIAIER